VIDTDGSGCGRRCHRAPSHTFLNVKDPEMSDKIVPFPKSQRIAALAVRGAGRATVEAIEADLAVARRSLDDLRTTQRLTEMAAEAIQNVDLDRMIAIRDLILGRIDARADARTSDEQPLPVNR